MYSIIRSGEQTTVISYDIENNKGRILILSELLTIFALTSVLAYEYFV